MLNTEEFYKLISTKPVRLKGEFTVKRVWINYDELSPEDSQTVYNHSAIFDWGDSGPGSAQLALAILLKLTNNKKLSMILHHIFKSEFLINLPKSDFDFVFKAGDWFYTNISRNSSCLD